MPKSTDLLNGHVCSASPLFNGMYDCAHINKEVAQEKGKIVNYDPEKGNGSLSNLASVIAPYTGESGACVYNKLTKGSRSDLLTNALNAGDLAYNANPQITPDELGTVIAKALLDEFKSNDIPFGKGHASTGSHTVNRTSKKTPGEVAPEKVDLSSLITPPNPDTDPEYKALLDKVSEAQEKSNALLNDPNADPTEGWNAMLALKASQKAVVEYAKTHADTSALEKKIDDLENEILEDEIGYEDTWNRINALCEKARRFILDRNAKTVMLEKAKALLPSTENGTENGTETK